MGIYDKVVGAAKGATAAIKAGNSETTGLGNELAERARMNRLAMGKSDEEKPVDKGSPNPTAGGNSPYGSRKGEKRLDTSYLDKPTAIKAPVYDKGGKVNVNDGKHQVAILKHGERVLTPKQNKDYEKQVQNRPSVKPPIPEELRDEPMHVEGHSMDDDAAASSAVLYDKGGKVDCYDEGGKVHTPEEKAHFARSMHSLNEGGLHRHLGISEDKPIPMAKKQAAANSDNPHVAAMGRMAVAMHGWDHKKK